MVFLSVQSLIALRSSVLTKFFAYGVILFQMLTLLSALVKSCDSVDVDEMFLLRITAASDLTSAFASAIK